MDNTSPPSASGRFGQIPSLQIVDDIVGVTDPVVRNLRITHAYHLLSVSLSKLTGDGANWCTFAVWASRQAGQTIRGEDLFDALERTLRARPDLTRGLSRTWRRLFLAALERPGSRRSRLLRLIGSGAFTRASQAVSRGNLKVFDEIGRLFADFIFLCGESPPAPDALATFLGKLRLGDPPEGQEFLRRAFSHYAAALRTSDLPLRAELLLLANLEIGLHEQTRLQPEILEALDAPFTATMELGRDLLDVLLPRSVGWVGVVREPLAALLGTTGRLTEYSLRQLLRHLLTESFITLSLPGGVVHLGRDLQGDFPESLLNPTTAELLEILDRFKPVSNDPDGSGADDWSVLDQRMILITRLFRSRHEHRELFGAPFTPEQVQAFEAGRLPDGEF